MSNNGTIAASCSNSVEYCWYTVTSWCAFVLCLLCILSSAFVLIIMCLKRKATTIVYKKSLLFASMTHECVTWMILSSLLSSLAFIAMFLQEQVWQLRPDHSLAFNMILTLFAELGESFNMSASLWALCVIVSTERAIRHMDPQEETITIEKYSKQTWILRGMYMLLAIVSPFVCYVVVLTPLEGIFGTYKGAPAYLVSLLPDIFKCLLVIVLEVYTMYVRVRIYRHMRSVLTSVSLSDEERPEANKKEERRIIAQLTLYSLPFLLCGLWAIIYRTVVNAYFVFDLAKDGINGFEDDYYPLWRIILHGGFRMSLPLQGEYFNSVVNRLGICNAIVYFYVSRTFREMIKSCIKRWAPAKERRPLLANNE